MPQLVWNNGSASRYNNRAQTEPPQDPNHPDLCAEAATILQAFRSDNPQSEDQAGTLLLQKLESLQDNRRKAALNDLDKLVTGDTLPAAVAYCKDHFHRRDSNEQQLRDLWGGNFIPKQYTPTHFSCHLLQELFGLSTEITVQQRQTLWNGGDPLLPRLINERPVGQRSTYLTVKVAQDARDLFRSMPKRKRR